MKCEHKRIKRNYPMGRKSKPDRHCKDCGEIITSSYLASIRNKDGGRR